MEMTSPTMTRESVLAGILAGDRTKRQMAERIGIDLDPIRDYRDPSEWQRNEPAAALTRMLRGLHCDDLLSMRVVDAEWHYTPTAKAKKK